MARHRFSVTGQYAYTARDGWDGSGQVAGSLITAGSAREAAEVYRATDVAEHLTRHPRAAAMVATTSNVCAVAITGPADTFSDPLGGRP